MPPFPAAEFTVGQLQQMRSAALECAGMLGVKGVKAAEANIAAAILAAARCGCGRHGDLVAVGLAAFRRQNGH